MKTRLGRAGAGSGPGDAETHADMSPTQAEGGGELAACDEALALAEGARPGQGHLSQQNALLCITAYIQLLNLSTYTRRWL